MERLQEMRGRQHGDAFQVGHNAQNQADDLPDDMLTLPPNRYAFHPVKLFPLYMDSKAFKKARS